MVSSTDQQIEQSYDEITYQGAAVRTSHPSHLAMLSILCGLTPCSPRQCRVLELGCATGANLIPMAADLPASQFVGIDLSANQVAQGQQAIDELGLQNIELLHKSILDVDATMGQFDYIICYGVYSWVPPEVQQKILDIGRQNLSDNGIMFISYNTFPGWHLRGMIRDAMIYHTRDIKSPKQKIEQARAMIDFMMDNSKSHLQAYPQLITELAKGLDGKHDCYIYHEFLEDFNSPVYFREFVQRANGSDLRFLANSEIGSMVASTRDPLKQDPLRNLPLVEQEQYRDFLECNTFRTSVLCRQRETPDYSFTVDRLELLHIALVQWLHAEESTNGDTSWKLGTGSITTQSPLTEIIQTLARKFPGWVSVKELLSDVPDTATRTSLLDSLMAMFPAGLIRLSSQPCEFATELSDPPRASNLSRWQARSGAQVTSRFHQDWLTTPQQCFLLKHLDGEHTIQELVHILLEEVQQGRLSDPRKESTTPWKLEDAQFFTMEQLHQFCKLGILEGSNSLTRS